MENGIMSSAPQLRRCKRYLLTRPYISLAMPVLALVRFGFGTRLGEKVYAVSFIVVLSMTAVVVFFMVPLLPE